MVCTRTPEKDSIFVCDFVSNPVPTSCIKARLYLLGILIPISPIIQYNFLVSTTVQKLCSVKVVFGYVLHNPVAEFSVLFHIFFSFTNQLSTLFQALTNINEQNNYFCLHRFAFIFYLCFLVPCFILLPRLVSNSQAHAIVPLNSLGLQMCNTAP